MNAGGFEGTERQGETFIHLQDVRSIPLKVITESKKRGRSEGGRGRGRERK